MARRENHYRDKNRSSNKIYDEIGIHDRIRLSVGNIIRDRIKTVTE